MIPQIFFPRTTNFKNIQLTNSTQKKANVFKTLTSSTIHLPLTNIKNFSHASITSLYRPPPNSALTLTFKPSLTAKNYSLQMANWQSPFEKPSLCPSSPVTYPRIPPALLALTSFSLIGTFKSASTIEEQIWRHNNIVDYNVSLLHSLQRNALFEPNAGLGKSADDIQTDNFPPIPPNSGSLLLDWTINSPVQQWFLASNVNLRNCKPLQAASNAFNLKINTYKDLLQLQPPGTKFLPLAIESLGTHPEVRNFLLQLAQCASRSSLISALQSNASFVAYHAQVLSVLTHVGTANSILDLAKKASTTF